MNMYCTNCGHYAEGEIKFCANCGEALHGLRGETAIVPGFSEAAEASAEAPAETAAAPELPEFAPPPQKEKLFFGKGAFAFCLAVIAVLSIISGMFIGLYINEKSRSPVNSNKGVTYHSKVK